MFDRKLVSRCWWLVTGYWLLRNSDCNQSPIPTPQGHKSPAFADQHPAPAASESLGRKPRLMQFRGALLRQWDIHGNLRAMSLQGLNAQDAVDELRPFAHVDHAEAPALGVLSVDGADVESDAIVLDLQDEQILFRPKPHPDMLCLSVFAGIVHRFLGDVEDHALLPHLEAFGDIRLAFDDHVLTMRFLQLLRELAQGDHQSLRFEDQRPQGEEHVA